MNMDPGFPSIVVYVVVIMEKFVVIRKAKNVLKMGNLAVYIYKIDFFSISMYHNYCNLSNTKPLGF